MAYIPPYSLSGNKVFCNYCPAYCCYRLEGSSLLITAEDINRIARAFAISDGEVRKRYLDGKNTFKVRDDGACIFLHDGRSCKRCSIHKFRPKQCQDFPYHDPCPYLECEELLQKIQPKIEKSLNLTETALVDDEEK